MANNLKTLAICMLCICIAVLLTERFTRSHIYNNELPMIVEQAYNQGLMTGTARGGSIFDGARYER